MGPELYVWLSPYMAVGCWEKAGTYVIKLPDQLQLSVPHAWMHSAAVLQVCVPCTAALWGTLVSPGIGRSPGAPPKLGVSPATWPACGALGAAASRTQVPDR